MKQFLVIQTPRRKHQSVYRSKFGVWEATSAKDAVKRAIKCAADEYAGLTEPNDYYSKATAAPIELGRSYLL